jgi:ABC-type sugar transport system permease subunit
MNSEPHVRTLAPSIAASGRPHRSQSGRPRLTPYMFLAPFFALWGAFWVYPVLYSLWLSFHRWTARATVPVGFDNYNRLLLDPNVQQAFANDAWYLIVNNLFQIPIALALALLLDAKFLHGRGFARAGFFAPNLVSGVVAAILFSIVLAKGGLLDSALPFHFGWLTSTDMAKPAVILVGGWRWIGYWVIILTAGLQQTPVDLKEAAAVEGAGTWQIFLYIVLPLLRPILFFVLIVNSIGTLQIFEEPLLLWPSSPGGPDGLAATTPVLEIYKAAFAQFDLGYAAAISWVLAVVIITIALVQAFVLRRGGWSA